MTDTPSKDEDFDLFLKEMRDVKPLALKKEKVELRRGSTSDPKGILHRRQAAVRHPPQDSNYLTTENIPKRNPHDTLEYRKPGVQMGVYRKLRLGKYAIEARLDLHRKVLEQARQEVFVFVHDCLRYDLRTVMIVHGKGDRGEDKAIIKSHVAYWLKQLPEVLAYHSAQRHHGGLGALYVMLKKSDKKNKRRVNN